MSKLEDYEAKLAIIQAISDDDIVEPNVIPVDIYVQEADDIYNWSLADQEQLVGAGLDWNIVQDIPARSGALSHAESLWLKSRFSQEDAQKEWKEKAPMANQFRIDLLHHLRYAFRNDDSLLSKLQTISEGYGYADMIQDLNDLSVLGKANPDLLAAINLDIAILDQAAELSSTLNNLWAVAKGEREEGSAIKKTRDQAYTHLKEAVDALMDCGQYVFWKNENRIKMYRSAYLKRTRAQQLAKRKEKKLAEKNQTADPEVKTN